MHTVKAGDNIFQALGFDAAESAELKLRSSLILALRQWLDANQFTQMEAAKQLGTTQARISDIENGKINNLGLKRLLAMADAAGLSIDVTISRAA